MSPINIYDIYYRPHTSIFQHTKKVKFTYKYIGRDHCIGLAALNKTRPKIFGGANKT
jgi:hypothetical protein